MARDRICSGSNSDPSDERRETRRRLKARSSNPREDRDDADDGEDDDDNEGKNFVAEEGDSSPRFQMLPFRVLSIVRKGWQSSEQMSKQPLVVVVAVVEVVK